MRERKLNRLADYDYATGGAYFVTICVQDRACVLGEVTAGMMRRNSWGDIAERCWHDLPNHYRHCRLDAMVIMPNHVHAILWIEPPLTAGGDPDVPPTVRNGFVRNGFVRNGFVRNGLKPFPTTTGKRHGLPEMIRGFKTFSSRRINESAGGQAFRWQKSYHDRIIRNDDELHRIREYIAANPANWQQDGENPVLYRP